MVPMVLGQVIVFLPQIQSIIGKIDLVPIIIIVKNMEGSMGLSEELDGNLEVPGSNGSNNILQVVPKEKRPSPANAWMFIAHVKEEGHNDECLDVDELKAHVLKIEDTLMRHGAERYIFQYECGAQGKYHFQGWFAFKKKQKKRWTNFKIWPGMSFIAANGSTANNAIYCSKEDTKMAGPWYHGIILPRELDTFEYHELYEWQKVLAKMFMDDCPKRDRSIYWFWEEPGNVGKSVLVTYLIDHYNATEAKGTDKDVCYSLKACKDEKGEVPVTLCIDLCRSSKRSSIPYQTLEDCKNGRIFSEKYESGMLRIPPIHVVIFANYPPDESKFSTDRWKIFNLNDWIAKRAEEAAINLI